MRTLPILIAALLTSSACYRVSLYELPPPPPQTDQGDVSLIPGEEERKDEERYLDARAAVIQVFNLLSTKRYDEAVERMSLETRDFLKGGGKRSAADVLVDRKMKLPNGEVVEIDPVATLVAEDVSKLSDSVAGMEEHETEARREIFATLPSGRIQKIVMIKEKGQWVLHRTRIPEPFDLPQ